MKKLTTLMAAALAVVFLVGFPFSVQAAPPVNIVNAVIKGADSAEGLVAPAPVATHVLVDLDGPGTFVSARLVKQGGATGLTAFSLVIDGNLVVQRNIAALKNWGMTQSNPFGVSVFTNGSIDTVTIGFVQPIEFENDLIFSAIVNEAGVVQIIGTVIFGED